MNDSSDNNSVSNSLENSLLLLHEKQDEQTQSLHEMKTELATQKVILDIYTKQQEQITTQLTSVNERLTEYNHQLKVHIQGVQELKIQNQLIRDEISIKDKEWSSRLEIAEKPIKWAEHTATTIKWIGVAATAIGSIGGILKLIGLI